MNKGLQLINSRCSDKKVLAYVDGAIGENNLGDEALFYSMKSLFNHHNLIHIDGSRTQKYILLFDSFIKEGILAGGTLIYQSRWLEKTKRFLDICPNLYVFGTGVANQSFWSTQKEWRNDIDQWIKILSNCRYVGVRGPVSAELLYDAGIKNVEVVGDPVITLAKEIIEENYINNSIGLNIGQSYGKVWGNEKEILEQYIKLALHAKKANWDVHWFVVCPGDLEITYKAAIKSGTESNINEIYHDAEKYIEIVKNMSVFVGMKLHSVVLATCAYVPSVMLEYRPKCLDYMKSINNEDFTIRTDRFSGDEVWQIASSINNKRNEYAEILFKNVKDLQIRQRNKLDDLLKIMNS